MSTTWDGPTPYEEPALIANDIVDRNQYRRQGYRAAMNSPEVMVMYAALLDISAFFESDSHGKAQQSFAGYEAGLKEKEETT